jgi:hypothetical protein
LQDAFKVHLPVQQVYYKILWVLFICLQDYNKQLRGEAEGLVAAGLGKQ